MIAFHRRGVLLLLAGGIIGPMAGSASAQTRLPEDLRRHVIAEAERMRREAVARGDQSYGAVVVKGNAIVGWGPSRVVTDRNANAHAERVAVWDAQARLGTRDLAGALLYSTSHPCSACESAAAGAGIARMLWGPNGTDGGQPRRR